MTENHDFSSLAHAAALASLQRMVLDELGSTNSQNEIVSELKRHMQAVTDAPPIIEENVNANEQENTETLEKIVTILKKQEAVYRDNAFNPLLNDRDAYDIGETLTVLTKSEEFMDKIVFQHLLSRAPARQLPALKILCLAATHLHKDIVMNDSIYDFLVKEIKDSIGELQSHAAFLLAHIISVREPAEKTLNIERIPRILLSRFVSLVEELMQGDEANISVDNQGMQASVRSEEGVVEATTPVKRKLAEDPTSSGQVGSEPTTPAVKRFKQTARRSVSHGNQSTQWIAPPPLSLSHVSWAELNEVTLELIYIMTALTVFAESQEVSPAISEENFLSTILSLLSGAVPKPNKFLLNETLRLLCTLFMHRKFASEFVHKGGVQSFLRVPKTTYLSEGIAACFLGLANLGTVMSIICLLPSGVLHELVKYSLYLILGSNGENNVGGGKLGAIFLSLIFSFQTMLDIFDKLDGLRSLVNLITVLYPSGQSYTGIDDIEDRQTLRNACLALRQYFRMHLTILAAEVRNRIAAKTYGNGAPSSTKDPPYKMTTIDYNTIVEDIKLIEDNYLIAFPLLSSSSPIDGPSATIRWKPVQKFMHLDMTPVLLRLIDSSTKWKMADMCLYCMEIFHIITLCPGTHLTIVGHESEEGKAERFANLYDNITEGDENLPDFREVVSIQTSQFVVSNEGMGYIIDAANGKLHSDSEIRKSALEVLCNLVRRQFYFPSLNKNISASPMKAKHLKGSNKELHPDIIARTVWQAAREHNGILMLIRNLDGKGIPIVHQDDVRLLSTKCLVGLAGDPAIRNILTKLKIYRYLADMIREPKLEEKALSHKQFCQFALELIRCTTSKNVVLPPAITDEVTDATLSRIERAAVVQSTEITFSDQELLLVIYRHLQSKGLVQSAEALAKESRLGLDHPGSLNAGSSTIAISMLNATPSRIKTRRASKSSSPHTFRKATTTPTRSRPVPDAPVTSVSPTSGLPSKSPFKITPRKAIINLKSESFSHPVLSMSSPSKKNTQSSEYLIQSQPPLSSSSTDRANCATLDRIVTEYLKQQHSHCHNPTSVLPPISLLESHYCPEAKLSSLCDAPKNFARRSLSRQIDGNYGGTRGRKMDKAMVYRNFKPIKSYKLTQPYEDDETIPTCASFYKHGERILIGDHLGSIFQFNTETAEEYESWTLMDSPIWSLKIAPDDALLLVSSPVSGSALWNFESMVDPVATFAREKFALFNSTGSMMVGTSDDSAARLYDLTTSQPIMTLNDSLLNNYRENNVAIFNLSDDQVLNNFILWDIRSQTKIHKFDRLTNYSLPAFNPNGHDLVINNLIWDVRTFKLLRTCSNLDKALIKFNSTGDVIYGIMQDGEYRNKLEGWRQSFGSVFRTFDADDYSTIATIECERKIFDLCVEETDNYIACVENGAHSTQLNPSDTAVKLYAVGRKRLIPDDSDSEREDEEEFGNDDMDDDDDDDDYPYDNDEEIEEVESFGDAEYSDDGESDITESENDSDMSDFNDGHGNVFIFGESQDSDGEEDAAWTGDLVDDDDDEWETEEDDY